MADKVSQKLKPSETEPRRIVGSLNRVLEGRLDAYDSLTLTPNAASTVFEHPLLSVNSTLILTPRSAHAAAALATTYVSAKANRSFTIAHANNAQTDRDFDVAWIG